MHLAAPSTSLSYIALVLSALTGARALSSDQTPDQQFWSQLNVSQKCFRKELFPKFVPKSIVLENVATFCTHAVTKSTFNTNTTNELQLIARHRGDSLQTPLNDTFCVKRFRDLLIDFCGTDEQQTFGGILQTADGWEYVLRPLDMDSNKPFCLKNSTIEVTLLDLLRKYIPPDFDYGDCGQSSTRLKLVYQEGRRGLLEWMMAGVVFNVDERACVPSVLAALSQAFVANQPAWCKRRLDDYDTRDSAAHSDWPEGFGEDCWLKMIEIV